MKDLFKQLKSGQSLVELLLAVGLAAIFLPALLTGLVSSREGRVQQDQRLQATAFLNETKEAVRNIREKGWSSFSVDGTYYPVQSGSSWTFSSGSQTVNGFTRSVVISDISRDSTGKIVTTGGTVDNSTKQVVINVSWTQPTASSITETMYMTRYLDNASFINTTVADFNTGIMANTEVPTPPVGDGEVTISHNSKAKWCSPAFSNSTIDLPDGPPVAVAATASASVVNPNDVFVATAPTATSSVKLAYVNVTANVDPPVSTLRGIFTMDSSKYSAGAYPTTIPSPNTLDNNFKTNDVKYYKSAAGKVYALLATDLPGKEVLVVQVNNGSGDAWQDSTNKIYKYWTFFNTRQYQGDTRSTPNQDQDPFNYGAVSIATLGTRGYAISGGYLYVFDLSGIDSATPTSGLPMIGCRIELDGYDCSPGTGVDKKYSANQTGATWSNTATPAHNDCTDGGNVELYADNDVFPIQVGSNTYVYVAVGAATNPEFEIVNVSTVPTSSTSPKINASSCGTISSGSSAWHVISSLDFNSQPNTEEAANSVFGKSDGTRAYISSNGGIDANGDGQPDSKQFYVIDTSNKSAPKFLSGTPSTGATSGFYYGASPQYELFPKRSLTVLNGQRVILVGKDGFPADSLDPQEYQVLDLTNESTPNYCGGINFDSGFNDLTSVSEADGDNFVYMVANTPDKQLKIIQGGPDGTYLDSGTFESEIFNPGYRTAFNRVSSTLATPSNTSLRYQIAIADPVGGSCTGAAYTYVGPNGTTSNTDNYPATGGPIFLGTNGTYTNPGQCMKYKVWMTTTDYNSTPTLYDMSINYSP